MHEDWSEKTIESFGEQRERTVVRDSQLLEQQNLASLMLHIDEFPIDRESIPQERLNLVNRTRTSLFPWRGQFSPELIEILLDKYASSNAVVFDPFVGSGTTLYEASRKSLVCYGSEINPAAVEMARTAQFVNLNGSEREHRINKARLVIKDHMPIFGDLFSPQKSEVPLSSRERVFENMLAVAMGDPLVYNIVVNTIIRFTSNDQESNMDKFLNAFNKHVNIIQSLPYSPSSCKVFYADARQLPLESQSVSLVITSPPYINVFNYHQNSRKVMEWAGWNLLEVAKSEIGSNRKNRGNRFFTVIQYAIDMLQALKEIRRVLRPEGRIIMIIGRESNVRGVSFENFKILSALAIGGAGLNLVCRQERKFVTRFGETICEDLLHFTPSDQTSPPTSDDFPRIVGAYLLNEALKEKTPLDVRKDIVSAIKNVRVIRASPFFAAGKSRSTIASIE